MPFGFHLAMDTLPSGELQVLGFRSALACVRLSLSCPFKLLHTFTFPGPRGITPAFGYSAPHSSAGGTLTLLSNALLSAHYGPSRHRFAFDRLPGFRRLYDLLAPPVSQWGEDGFSSCSTCPCHRAVPTTPPK